MQSKIAKNIVVTLCTLVSLFLLTGCSLNKSNGVEVTIDAKVIDNDLDNKQLVVGGIDNSSISKLGDKCILSCNGIKIFDRSGEETTQDNIKIDDIITIMYDGIVEEKYPTEITNAKWVQISK